MICQKRVFLLNNVNGGLQSSTAQLDAHSAPVGALQFSSWRTAVRQLAYRKNTVGRLFTHFYITCICYFSFCSGKDPCGELSK